MIFAENTIFESFFPFPSWCGFLVLLLLTWVFSERRKQISIKVVVLSVALQFALVWFVLGPGKFLFLWIGKLFRKIELAYSQGLTFVLGPQLSADKTSLALTILPMVIFVSALCTLLYHYRILQLVVYVFAWIFKRTLGMSGPEAVAAAGNIFLGMAEAPVLIAPYLSRLSRSQLFMVMTTGMTTISGSLLVVYSSMVASQFGEGDAGFELAAAHLLAASVVSAPAAFLVARILIPERSEDLQQDSQALSVPVTTTGFFDALSQGALMGLKLTAYIVALLLSMVALISLFNMGLAFFDPSWSLEGGLGWLFSPLAWILGVTPADVPLVGQLLGIKMAVNEFLAYAQLGSSQLSSQSLLVLSWALCGFANFGSIAIMIGSLVGLCPERRSEISSLGLKAMMAGFIATCLTGTVVGTLG